MTNLTHRGLLGVLAVFSTTVFAADVLVSDSDPDIFFDDTNIVGPQSFEWAIATDFLPQTFSITQVDGSGFSIPAFQINRNALDSTLVLGADGAVGIGTSTPFGTLHLVSSFPALSLDNGEQAWTILSDDTAIGIGKVVEQRFPFLIFEDAPNGSLWIDPNGNVGMGVGSPTASLHILRSNAKLLVQETSTTVTPRAQLELRNNGPVDFAMVNTNTNQTWRFAAQTTGFRINFVDGVGPDFEVLNNGNVVARGTFIENSDVNLKSNIEVLDGKSVLAKLNALPISEWSYKKDGPSVRHVGPMAQDFYAAFGLGTGETTISPRDMAGVSMAAIKALKAEVVERDAKIVAQQEQVAALQGQVASLQHRLEELDTLQAKMAALEARLQPHQLPQQVSLEIDAQRHSLTAR